MDKEKIEQLETAFDKISKATILLRDATAILSQFTRKIGAYDIIAMVQEKIEFSMGEEEPDDSQETKC